MGKLTQPAAMCSLHARKIIQSLGPVKMARSIIFLFFLSFDKHLLFATCQALCWAIKDIKKQQQQKNNLPKTKPKNPQYDIIYVFLLQRQQKIIIVITDNG